MAHQIRSVYLCGMRGFLWLVGAVLLLGSIDGGDTYEQLDDKTRNIVDQAIIKANKQYGKHTHIDFDSINCSGNSGLCHVLLKPTSCNVKKGAGVHQKECTFPKKTKFMISCVVCDNNDMTCGYKEKDKEKIKELIKKCGSESHLPVLSGEGHALFSKVEGKEFGCLGCI